VNGRHNGDESTRHSGGSAFPWKGYEVDYGVSTVGPSSTLSICTYGHERSQQWVQVPLERKSSESKR